MRYVDLTPEIHLNINNAIVLVKTMHVRSTQLRVSRTLDFKCRGKVQKFRRHKNQSTSNLNKLRDFTFEYPASCCRPMRDAAAFAEQILIVAWININAVRKEKMLIWSAIEQSGFPRRETRNRVVPKSFSFLFA